MFKMSLNRLNIIHTLPFYFCKICFNIILLSMFYFPSVSLLQFSYRNSITASHLSHVCLYILLNLTTLIIQNRAQVWSH
jgi:hypothetical protein